MNGGPMARHFVVMTILHYRPKHLMEWTSNGIKDGPIRHDNEICRDAVWSRAHMAAMPRNRAQPLPH